MPLRKDKLGRLFGQPNLTAAQRARPGQPYWRRLVQHRPVDAWRAVMFLGH